MRTGPLKTVLIIFALWAAGLGAAAQFGKMSVIYDQLSGLYPDHRGFGIGILVSIIGIIGLVFGTTAGMVVARIGARRAMLGALALGAVVSLCQSFLPSYGWMLASRVPEGLSHLCIVVVGPTAIAAAAPKPYQPLVMTLWGTFFGVAFTILALFGPSLAIDHGTGALFLAHSVWLSFCFAALWLLMPTDPPVRTRASTLSLIAQHAAIYRSPWIAAPATGFMFYTVIYVAVLTLLPGALSPAWGHYAAVAMPLISIIVSMTLGVWLLSQMAAVQVVQAGFALAILASAGLWIFWGQGPAEIIFACLLSSAMGVVQGASFASIPQLNDAPENQARAAGAIAQLGNLGTTTGTPLLALLLLNGGVSGLAVFLIGFSALGILAHWIQERRRAVA